MMFCEMERVDGSISINAIFTNQVNLFNFSTTPESRNGVDW
jgi:hypothetical protein